MFQLTMLITYSNCSMNTNITIYSIEKKSNLCVLCNTSSYEISTCMTKERETILEIEILTKQDSDYFQ
jgi:hypothetical protein